MSNLNEPQSAPVDHIVRSILILRGQRVLLDADLAALYGAPTKVLVQAIKRNRERFPADFMFQLTKQELADLRSQFVTSSSGWGGRRYPPYAFAEHGALMAANLLNSPRAVEMSIFVVRAFVQLRELLASHKDLAGRLDELEIRFTKKLDAHDQSIAELFDAVRQLMNPPVTYAIGFTANFDQPAEGSGPYLKPSAKPP